MALENHSTIDEFILLCLSADPHIQALFFVLFLEIYVLTMTGNLLMLLVIRADSHLHMPMYFFLSNLSFLDICFSSITVLKLLENLFSQKKTISVKGCLAQVFFLFVSGVIEVGLLSVMAQDHYVAICHPLLYGEMISNLLCKGLVWGSWVLGLLIVLLNTLPAMKLDFCGDDSIPHYSCELPSLFPLSCSDVSTSFTIILSTTLPYGLGTSFLISFFYACIVSTNLSISSSSGRSKDFSTCSSHLTTVFLLNGSAFLPVSISPLELIFSVQYSVVTPLVNPFIYSLKNNEVKAAVKRTLKKYLH